MTYAARTRGGGRGREGGGGGGGGGEGDYCGRIMAIPPSHRQSEGDSHG